MMIKSYITIALRNLLREKVYAVINVVGLAIGIACALLLALYVHHDWRFDRHYEKHDRILRVLHETRTNAQGAARYALTHDEIGERLEEVFPEVIRSSRMIRSSALMGFSEDQMRRKPFLLVDADYAEMFTLPLVAGDRVLRRPDQAIITTAAAKDLLGEGDLDYASVVGRTIRFTKRGELVDYAIIGVVEHPPVTSTLRFSCLIPYENRSGYRRSSYNDWSTMVYVEVDGKVSLADLQAKVTGASLSLLPDQVADMRKKNRIGDGDDDFEYILQPLLDVRFDLDSRGGYVSKADGALVSTLAWIALVVLALSCVNFMTLSLSRSVSRATEVGVRKVVGAMRLDLIQQFWGEAIVTALAGLLLAGGLAELLLPTFNTLAGRSLTFAAMPWGWMLAIGLALALAVGAVGGGYPGIVLSRLRPATVLAGKSSGRSRNRITGVLIVLQYAVCTSLLISTLIIVRQMEFVRDADLGYTDDPLLTLDFHRSAGDVEARGERFLREASMLPGVVSTSRYTGDTSTFGLKMDGDGGTVTAFTTAIGPNYLQTLDVTLVDGRFFRTDGTVETRVALVNERFIRQTGYQVGDHILNYVNNVREPVIVGVFKDYHFDSLHREVLPQVMILDSYRKLAHGLIRIRGDRIRETMDSLKEIWQETGEDLPYRPRFLDDQVAAAYRKDERRGKIVGASAGFAILIACMGLFGQASLAITRRTKEIGVRKSVGATVADILRLLSRDLVVLFVVSNVVACPVAYYLSRDWLDQFSYRIALTPDLFAMGGVGAMMIAVVTVGWLGVRAARGNPVEALRYE